MIALRGMAEHVSHHSVILRIALEVFMSNTNRLRETDNKILELIFSNQFWLLQNSHLNDRHVLCRGMIRGRKTFQRALPAVWETYVCPQFFILCGKIKSICSPFYGCTCQNVLGWRHHQLRSVDTLLYAHGRGRCLTTFDTIPCSPEVTLTLGVTARKSCSWLFEAHWH